MLASANSSNRSKRRSQTGSQIAEFGAGLVLLSTLILIPLLDLVIVPVRWMMAQDIVNAYTRKFALCESLNESWRMLNAEPTLTEALEKLGGVSVKSEDLSVRVSTASSADEVLRLRLPAQIPADWLPNGSKAPCVYSLETHVDLEIAPAVLMRDFGARIPAVSSPIPIAVSSSHAWENLARNPASGEYFLNE
jgi:hypothetical protein